MGWRGDVCVFVCVCGWVESGGSFQQAIWNQLCNLLEFSLSTLRKVTFMHLYAWLYREC